MVTSSLGFSSFMSIIEVRKLVKGLVDFKLLANSFLYAPQSPENPIFNHKALFLINGIGIKIILTNFFEPDLLA